MAAPAQVASDMAAHATYWEKRDLGIERLCRDAARVIRLSLSGERVDGRTWAGLQSPPVISAEDAPPVSLSTQEPAAANAGWLFSSTASAATDPLRMPFGTTRFRSDI